MKATASIIFIFGLFILTMGYEISMADNSRNGKYLACDKKDSDHFYRVAEVIFPTLQIVGIKKSSCQQGWVGVETSNAFILDESTDLSSLDFEPADGLGATPWGTFQRLLPEESPNEEELSEFVVAYGFNNKWKSEIHILRRREGKSPFLAMITDLP